MASSRGPQLSPLFDLGLKPNQTPGRWVLGGWPVDVDATYLLRLGFRPQFTESLVQ